jgi:hypothetical protein
MDEEPENLEANVQKLEKRVPKLKENKGKDAEFFLRKGSFWLLQDKRKIKVCIYLEGKEVRWFGDGNAKSEILDEYIEDVLNHIRENKLDGEEFLIAQFGKDPNKQIELAQSGSDLVQCFLANNKNLDPRAQRILGKCENLLVKFYLATNPIITPEVQMSLAATEDMDIITGLAKNLGLIPQLQYYIAEKGHDYAKMYLAENPRILPDVQIILAKIDYGLVRAALASNPSIVPQAEKILINSKGPLTKMLLAENEGISEQAQLALVEEGVKERDGDVLKILAERKKLCPLAELALAKSPYPEIRELISQRPNLSKEARKILETPCYSLQESKQDASHALRWHGMRSQRNLFFS